MKSASVTGSTAFTESQPDSDAGQVGQHGERRDHDESGQHPRNDQVRRRRASQALQRVDLLGHPHGAELGGIARADAAGQDQRGQHRPQLQDDGGDDQRADDVVGDAAGELIAGLERGHRPGKGRDQHDDEEAAGPDVPGLDHHPGPPDPDLAETASGIEHEIAQPAHVRQAVEHPAAQRSQHVHGRESGVRSRQSGVMEPWRSGVRMRVAIRSLES